MKRIFNLLVLFGIYGNAQNYMSRPYPVQQPVEQGGDLYLAQRVLIEKQRQYEVNKSNRSSKSESDKYHTRLRTKEPETTTDIVGGYYVPVIEEQSFVNNRWVASKTEYYNAFLFFDRNLVWFKRGDNVWLYRQTIFKYHSIENESYFYESANGSVIMDDKFRFILFADSYDVNKRYMYIIGEKNPNITLKTNK